MTPVFGERDDPDKVWTTPNGRKVRRVLRSHDYPVTILDRGVERLSMTDHVWVDAVTGELVGDDSDLALVDVAGAPTVHDEAERRMREHQAAAARKYLRHDDGGRYTEQP